MKEIICSCANVDKDTILRILKKHPHANLNQLRSETGVCLNCKKCRVRLMDFINS